MPQRTLRTLNSAWILIMVALALGLSACSGEGSQEAAQAFSTPGTDASLPEGHPAISGTLPAEGDAPSSVAGLEWSVPESWQAGQERPMRAATYLVAPESGDPEGAECAVFYFGADQGGDVESNIQRWISQFEQPDGSPSTKVASTGKLEVDGLAVTTVEVSGTYTASMGPMSGTQSNKENFHLQGAIVEGPQGAVFFKMTGPAKTVGAARTGFDAMIKSVHKTSGEG